MKNNEIIPFPIKSFSAKRTKPAGAQCCALSVNGGFNSRNEVVALLKSESP